MSMSTRLTISTKYRVGNILQIMIIRLRVIILLTRGDSRVLSTVSLSGVTNLNWSFHFLGVMFTSALNFRVS